MSYAVETFARLRLRFHTYHERPNYYRLLWDYLLFLLRKRDIQPFALSLLSHELVREESQVDP